ncbi:flagellar export protein FliJ [Solidesulfovibrio carbinoliphilus subsp. oakridgensis]|uniref:Flagellar FliJ protein n=1 Tax=Solidesulfovibrio carbinoliphilus subsp. oakridgensis TaxID=694327 RepID=G7Q5C2_9BACT|nr:flagellar export protein FliJ [Solidesulfovibrio carbinoliphilus]EHJ48923.1 flagellar export protein FliJ [Solidesulfovibrio carbinoliphilus subsp. oakridgensis]
MAKPFRFNLERVLDIRAQLEERARMELGKAIAAHQLQAREVARLENELASRDASMTQKKNPAPLDFYLWRAYRERLVFDIRAGHAKLDELAEVRERCRVLAVSRSKDRKLLDKLKTNKARRHALEENIAEQKENDEMASVRYVPPVV